MQSANHKQAIAIEMTMRVSVFHKESTEKEKVGKDFQIKAFLAAYWLMKEEVQNKKFLSLISMLSAGEIFVNRRYFTRTDN